MTAVHRPPQVVVFDVNGTLSDLGPLTRRFTEVGAKETLAATWFSCLLRDGFALTVAGGSASFSDLAQGALRAVLADQALVLDADAAVDHVLAGLEALPVHADVPGGVRALHSAGLRLVTLSNGSTGVAERLLGDAGLRDRFERLLSVDDAGTWKPAYRAYAYAAEACGVDPGQMLLAAAHPWDIDGAVRAGLGTAWIDRGRAPYPSYFTAPQMRAGGIDDLARQLAG